jgi:hypothetical protein
MKKLIYYSISVFIFLSCEKKKDPAPTFVNTTLKELITEGISPNRTVKSIYSLIYTNDKLSNLQRIDTIREDGLPPRTGPTINNFFTGEVSEGYKLISDYAVGGANGFTVSKVETIAKKTATGYDVETTYIASQQTFYSQMEFNSSNQLVKNTITKLVKTDKNGVKRETPYDLYNRFEYDVKGNVVRVFLKDIGSSSEVLINEYTYDDKPSPYSNDLRWLFRLSGVGGAAGVESKNNVLTSKNYQQGILLTETTGVYTYDTQTNYPLIVTTTGKSFSPNVGVGTSKTIYKY